MTTIIFGKKQQNIVKLYKYNMKTNGSTYVKRILFLSPLLKLKLNNR